MTSSHGVRLDGLASELGLGREVQEARGGLGFLAASSACLR